MRNPSVLSRITFLLAALLLSGCGYQSMTPWWKERDCIAISGIEGRWVSENDKKTYDVVKGEPGEYVVTPRPRQRKDDMWILTFTKIDHAILADITAPVFDLYKINVHGVSQVSFQGNEATFLDFSDDAMKTAIAKYQVACLKSDSGQQIIAEPSSSKLFRVLEYVLHPPKKSERPSVSDKFRKVK